MRVLVLPLALALLTTGCAGYFRDRSLEYDKATSTPPLVLPAGAETRPIKPLYPVPPAPANARRPVRVTEPPAPPAMAAVQSVEQQPLPDTQGRLAVKLGTDGNGVPELRVIGPRERVWDELGAALTRAGITVKDRNQSFGLVDVLVDQRPYQVRMVRGAEAFVINLQRDENSLAPVPVARSVLSNLQARWP